MRRNTADYESHFAAVDPQYSEIDDDVIAWRERRSELILRRFKDVMTNVINKFAGDMVIEDVERLQENAEDIGEWITEFLEEEL